MAINFSILNSDALCKQHGTYTEHIQGVKAGRIELMEGPTSSTKISLTEAATVLSQALKPISSNAGNAGYLEKWVAWAIKKDTLLTEGSYGGEGLVEKPWEAVCRMVKFLESGSGLLDLSGLALQDLPDTLPPNVISLNLEKNDLVVLPNLPASILTLRIDDNKISFLQNLPKDLVHLSASQNYLTGKNIVFPPTLEKLNLANNKLTALPKLPEKIKSLNIENNPELKMSEQILPIGLREIYAAGIVDNKQLANKVLPHVKVTNTAPGVIGTVKNVVEDMAKGIGHVASATVETAKNVVDDTAKGIGHIASDSVETVKDVVGGAAKGIKDIASDSVGTAKAVVGDVAKGAGSVLSETAEAVKNVAVDVKDAL